MARPQKEGLDYFPHDVYASSDEKIEPLILLYGSKGYSFYFLHLEYIYRNKDLSLDISDAETREVICQKLHINEEEYQKILQTALKKHCFDKEIYETLGRLTSNGVKKRASVVSKKREETRAAYESRKNKIISDAETHPETPQSKVKESKVKESINKDILNINKEEKRCRCGNVFLTDKENEKILNQFEQKDRMVKSLKYITEYSKLKTGGYISNKTDFEEIIQLIKKDREIKP